jgi:hypothetical protein
VDFAMVGKLAQTVFPGGTYFPPTRLTVVSRSIVSGMQLQTHRLSLSVLSLVIGCGGCSNTFTGFAMIRYLGIFASVDSLSDSLLQFAAASFFALRCFSQHHVAFYVAKQPPLRPQVWVDYKLCREPFAVLFPGPFSCWG